MLDRPEEYARMAEVEEIHWWYKSLHQRVIHTLTKYGLGSESPILDAACGTGGLMLKLREAGFQSLQGFDFSEVAVQFCRSRGMEIGKHSLLEVKEVYPQGHFAGICSLDTLCYLEPPDWIKVTTGLADLLAPRGLLVFNLPSFSGFAGTHDLSVGIKRRFSKADLPRLYDPSRLELLEAHYWPFLLSPLIYLVRRLQRRALSRNPRLPLKSDLHFPVNWINRPLYLLTCLEYWLRLPCPWGSSLYLVFQENCA